jgi:hypothetical protein
MGLGDSVPTDCNHQIGGADLLRLVLRRERCAHDCYATAREQVVSPETYQMLSAIAARQQEQIARLEALLASAETDASEAPPMLSDLDPPNRPE